MSYLLLAVLLLVGHALIALAGSSDTIKASSANAHDFSPYYRTHCKTHPEKCAVLDINIDSLSKQNLVRSLESVDFLRQEQELLDKHHVFYVIVTIKDLQQGDINGNSSSVHQQYEELDNFITARSWWKVHQYPVIYQRQSRSLPLLLEHLPGFLTEVGKNLAVVHFPPAEECPKRRFLVRSGMSSWGIDISNMDDYFNRNPDYIHVFYVQNQGKHVHEGHVDKNHGGCGDKFNLHACCFLESTNCSFPASFLKFCNQEKSTECVRSGIYEAYNRSYVSEYSLPSDPHLPAEQIFPRINYQPYSSLGIKIHDPYIVNVTTAEIYPRLFSLNSINVYQHHWKFGIAYKYNYHLGVRIQQFLQEFYGSCRKTDKTESFGVHDHCIGVHIRKGDRSIPGVDMIAWCKNHTKIAADGSHTFTGNWIDGSPMTYGNFADMGCGYNMPFGAVNLQHIVNGSLLLANETLYSAKHRLNVLVMTDEIPTLEQEVAEFQKTGYARDKVHIVVFPTKLESVHKSRLSWQATVEWWAGIEALKKCSGYIMHTSSAASSAIFNALCYNHGEGYMKCPPGMFIE